jgi:hypothetical protein
MGDYHNLVAFGRWAKERYPARRYMLIVWNHGTGWLDKPARPKGISLDYETNNGFNIPELAAGIKAIGRIDLYASDACQMQMAEVAAELQGLVPLVAGSEENTPGDGYKYDAWLGALNASPGMDAETLGRVLVDTTGDFYTSVRDASTQSLLRTSAFPGFIAALDGFAAAMQASGEREIIEKARFEARIFANYDNRDLYDFAQLVAAGTLDPAVKASAETLMRYIKEKLVIHNRTSNGPWEIYHYEKAYGVAIYIPMREVSPAYASLRWAAESRWDDFVKWRTPAAKRLRAR